CSVDLLLHQVAVLAMNSRENKIHRRFHPRVTLKDSEGLVGPEDFPTDYLPAEAPRATEPLSFRQVRFATLQLLAHLFLLSYIHSSANDPLQNPVLDNRDTDTTDVTNGGTRQSE